MIKKIIPILLIILMSIVLMSCNNNNNNSMELYLVSGELPEDENIDINSLSLDKTPILSSDDIQKYYWEDQALILKEKLLSDRIYEQTGLKIPPVKGLPYVVVVNGERIYMGKFWTALSSIWPYSPSICDFPRGDDPGQYDIQSGQELYYIYWDKNDDNTEQMVFDERIYKVLEQKGILHK